ncbi:hypothetical protein [Corynebacterium amycolatum]|uniref:hypothetical protein n=1 Tax=Corynebacterium amycolatum TaxID=43765 RepID=UPI00383564F9
MTTNYSAADSLAYLANTTMLDIAIELLEELNDNNPSVQVSTSIQVIRTMEKLIQAEASAHNVADLQRYSNEVPVNISYTDEEGEMTSTLHPSGNYSNPALGMSLNCA